MREWCRKNRQKRKEYYQKHREQRQEYQKQWRQRHPKYNRDWHVRHPEYNKEHGKIFNKKNPNRNYGNSTRTPKQWRAHNYVQRHPELLLSQCELCPDDNIQTENLRGHHPDYDYPEIFVTICSSCHNFIHKGVS
jgi:hypothetical protein